jgi:DNA-directed RNA polymerase specialized sigma subunit
MTTDASAATDADYDRALVEDNLRLVDYVISRWGFDARDGYTRKDAWQDGTFGLVTAARRYDPKKGKFSTIAVIHIYRAIRNGRGLYGGVSYRTAVARGERAPMPMSLQLPAHGRDSGDGASGELGDVVLIDQRPGPDALAERTLLLDRVAAVAEASCIDEIDRALLASLFDFDDDRFPTNKQADVAGEFGISPEAVRRRQVRLFNRVRDALAGTEPVERAA